jgi:hypothetical protein
MAAATNGKTDFLKFLVDGKADVNVQDKVFGRGADAYPFCQWCGQALMSHVVSLAAVECTLLSWL